MFVSRDKQRLQLAGTGLLTVFALLSAATAVRAQDASFGHIIVLRDVPYGEATHREAPGDPTVVETAPREPLELGLQLGLQPLSDSESATISGSLAPVGVAVADGLELGLGHRSGASQVVSSDQMAAGADNVGRVGTAIAAGVGQIERVFDGLKLGDRP